MFSYKISDLLHTATILLSLQTITNGQNHPSDLPKTVGHESTPIKEPEVYIAKVDIQCGNNYNTFPIGKGMVSCTNYGDWQYKCKEESCYVGTDRKKLASEELNFYDCARLGIAELLPEILAVRYKAANLGGAIEIMDENGQEYGCRWTKPSDPSNVRHAHTVKNNVFSNPQLLSEAICNTKYRHQKGTIDLSAENSSC
ncbi:hypothetical protein MJO28_014720 [Puccinia striiformis f. sp. tritici]|uniref:Cyanovirin-N domain-containing protein n=2 Tax=Puccinia striiformis TaxID=27350 RepID=A0A2S4VER8_9BASI|nr:hypothetical protein MJO28_014720 [Puccinia striiformis f. sp. tritici]POW08032.1 hypothetical protein PSTT_07835 [Puccinia striiformis]